MGEIKRILDGLEILIKYYPSADTAFEHDQMWVYNWREEVEVSKEDKQKLDNLGWFIDDDEDNEGTWSHF